MEAQLEHVHIAYTFLHILCQFACFNFVLINKMSASVLNQKFTKSALFVGQARNEASEEIAVGQQGKSEGFWRRRVSPPPVAGWVIGGKCLRSLFFVAPCHLARGGGGGEVDLLLFLPSSFKVGQQFNVITPAQESFSPI